MTDTTAAPKRARKPRPPREIPFSEIESRFKLAAYWFGEKWCPAVCEKNGGYSIRVSIHDYYSGDTRHTKFDYFYLDADGLVTTAPRGYARDYKPGQVTGLAEAVAKYAPEDQTAQRMRFGF